MNASRGVHRIAGNHAHVTGLCDETVAVIEDELVELVERMFERVSVDVASWPDPHPDRRRDDGEYSRVTNAARYRILGARADAWADAAIGAGLAIVQGRVEWAHAPQTHFHRPYLVVPRAVGALPVVIARHRLGDCDDAGLTFGAGNPAFAIDFLPDCGCDACDSGSQDLLEGVDRSLHAIITGRYRRLSKGNQVSPSSGRAAHRATSTDDAPTRSSASPQAGSRSPGRVGSTR